MAIWIEPEPPEIMPQEIKIYVQDKKRIRWTEPVENFTITENTMKTY